MLILTTNLVLSVSKGHGSVGSSSHDQHSDDQDAESAQPADHTPVDTAQTTQPDQTNQTTQPNQTPASNDHGSEVANTRSPTDSPANQAFQNANSNHATANLSPANRNLPMKSREVGAQTSLNFDQIVGGAVVICAAADNAALTNDPSAAALATNCQGAQKSVSNLVALKPELAENYVSHDPGAPASLNDPLYSPKANQIFSELQKNNGATREQKIFEVLHSNGSSFNANAITTDDFGKSSGEGSGANAKTSGSSRTGSGGNGNVNNNSANPADADSGAVNLAGNQAKNASKGGLDQEHFNLKNRLKALLETNANSNAPSNLAAKYQYKSAGGQFAVSGSKSIRDVRLRSEDESFFAQAKASIQDTQSAQGARAYAELGKEFDLFDVVHKKYREKFEMLDPDDVLGTRKK